MPHDGGATTLWRKHVSWSAAGYHLLRDNGQVNVITINTCHSLILGRKTIAATRLEGLIVIDTEDILLVCNGKNTEGIKTVLEKLRKREIWLICNASEPQTVK